MIVVIDTNVLVSLVLARSVEGTIGRIGTHWREGRFDVFFSREIVDEITRVTSRPKIVERTPGGADTVARLLARIESRRDFFVELPADRELYHPDPTDNDVLWTAIVARADCLVTGDAQLLALTGTRGVDVLTPRAFAEKLATTM